MVTLAVDYNLDIAKRVASLMEEIDPSGFHKAEDNPSTAIETVRRHKPDIVWLDIRMPEMNGLELAEDIRKVSSDTNIVFVTDSAEYALDAFRLHASGYLLKPVLKEQMLEEIKNLRRPVDRDDNGRLTIRCFGSFEVFHRGSIVKFTRALSKEALAYLVDRRGAGCTVSEICSVLWEDRTMTTSLKSQCRVIMAALKKDLEEIGANDVLVKMWNTWSIDANKVSCDYFDYLRNDEDAVSSFHGEYMSQYSWAEMTAGTLFNDAEEEE